MLENKYLTTLHFADSRVKIQNDGKKKVEASMVRYQSRDVCLHLNVVSL